MDVPLLMLSSPSDTLFIGSIVEGMWECHDTLKQLPGFAVDALAVLPFEIL